MRRGVEKKRLTIIEPGPEQELLTLKKAVLNVMGEGDGDVDVNVNGNVKDESGESGNQNKMTNNINMNNADGDYAPQD